MVQLAPLFATVVTALLFGQAVAHPGHSVDHEIAERVAYLKHAKKDLSHCQAKLANRGVHARAVSRRSEAVAGLRQVVKNKKLKKRAANNQHGSFSGVQTVTITEFIGCDGHTSTGGHDISSSASTTSDKTSSSKTTSDKTSSSGTTLDKALTSKTTSDKASSSKTTVVSSEAASSKTTVSTKVSSSSSKSLTTSTVSASASSKSATTSTASASASSKGVTTTVASSVVSSSASATFASGSNASGSFPSGAMPSGTPGSGNSTTSSNSTGDAGQLASSISTFGEEVANTSHLSTLDVTPDTSNVEELIFSNRSCVLSPDGEIGPFYVSGELIRTDIAETQEGVPIYIDGQFIDVSTCEPIEDLYWDLWHANSTGVYGGVIGNGNGNSDDTSNLNNTFLRGLQPTDSDGVAQFQSVFPGHYAGRATHIHVVTHIGGTVLSNGTYQGGNLTHIGQLFFDQDLITKVNAITPYSTNTIAIVDNDEDRVFAAETETDSDPVFDYVLLGDDISDGIFAWVSVGIDTSASYTASAAAAYGADGGVLE